MSVNKFNINDKEEDFKIVKCILDGDKSKYKILEKKYKKIVAVLIRKMVKNEDDVKDLTQETFIKAYNALASFQFGFSFSAWIYRIASNNCIDFLRKKRFPTISIDQPLSNDADDDRTFEIEDKGNRPDLDMIKEEKINLLNTAIQALPDNYREIIKLRHEEELDYNEISLKLNLPLGTVKAHLFRARKLLFISLKKHQSFFTDA